MRWLSCPVAGKQFPALALVLTLAVGFGVAGLRADQGQKNLQLEAFINDVPSNIIASFVLFDGSRIGATGNELSELGLRVGTQRFPTDIVMLDDIPGLKYDYDERSQLDSHHG